MSTNDTKAPREFWINSEETYGSIRDGVLCGIPEDQMVHVIEYSAYEALKKERDEAMMSCGYSNPEHEPLINKVHELQAQLDEAKKKLGIELANKAKESKRLQTQYYQLLERVVEAEAVIQLAVGSITPYEGNNGLPTLDRAVEYYNKYLGAKSET